MPPGEQISKRGAPFISSITFILDSRSYGLNIEAENCGQYLNKGSGVIVEGRLQERRWETDDGQKRTKHEVVAQSVQFLPKRQETGGEKVPPVSDEGLVDQDVPF